MFVAVEAIAGVEHVHGRAFYGLRRQATDLAPEFATDARVLNRLSGHLDSATRERVYQEKENQRVRARAAKARRSMRQFPAGAGPAGVGRGRVNLSHPAWASESPHSVSRCRGFT
jgi:hypothetical protein